MDKPRDAAAVIMAGGKGERFWPLSRQSCPKQFLRLLGPNSLLQETVMRVATLVPPERIYVVTGQGLVHMVKEHLSAVPGGRAICSNVIVEPEGRDTAPCIALAALVVKNDFASRGVSGDPVMIVLPSDHVIADVPSFTASLTLAAQVASLTGGLVTIGITPTRPETKYGYLELADAPETGIAGTSLSVGMVAGDEGPAERPRYRASILTPPAEGLGAAWDGRRTSPLGKPNAVELTSLGRSNDAWQGHEGRPRVYRVVKFTEKPDEAKAMKFLSSGRHLWNSGMFAWRTSAITEALSRHLPGMKEGMVRLEEALLSSGLDPASEASVEAFKTLPKISVDYGVMEKASNVYAVKGDFGWDDVGTWSALKRLYPSDSNGNVILMHPAAGGNGVKPLTVDSRGCLVYANDRLVACVGVEDLIVVDAGDVVLVCGKDREHHLRTLLASMRSMGLNPYL